MNIIGAKCYNRTANSEFFEWWFAEYLLKEIPEGHTVIMDNASFHRKSKLNSLQKKNESWVDIFTSIFT